MSLQRMSELGLGLAARRLMQQVCMKTESRKTERCMHEGKSLGEAWCSWVRYPHSKYKETGL